MQQPTTTQADPSAPAHRGPGWVTVENSSNVVGYEYDPADQTLVVEFKSGAYRYDGVPPAVVEELNAAASKGAFIATNIKLVYAATRIAEAEAV